MRMSVVLVKQRISVTEPHFLGEGLRGNICNSSVTR